MTRPTTRRTLLVTLAVAASATFGGTTVPDTRAADGRHGCTRAAISGVFALSFRGFIGSGATRQPVAAAGALRVDRDGTLTGRDTLSVDGAITPRVITGTYTIGRDPTSGACVGTATTSVGNFRYATTGEGRITGALFVAVDPGTTIEGRTIRQGSAGHDDD
jgi:hypothetical protein